MNEKIEKRRATNPAWILIAVFGVVAAVTLTACGGKDSPSTSASATTPSTSPANAGVPIIERAADGFFVARVEQGPAATPKSAAEEVCTTMQPELAQQLSDLGEQSALVLLQYGNGDPAERADVSHWGLAPGVFVVVSDTLSVCAVGAGG